DAFVFPSLAQRKKVSPLSKAFGKIMQRARIAHSLIRERTQKGRYVYSHSFHSLRHSFSTILANNNVSEEVRMRLTGPRHAASTRNTRIMILKYSKRRSGSCLD